MSIYSLMQDAARGGPNRRVSWHAPLQSRASKPKTPQDVASILTKYLPTEIVALYIAILPFLVPKNEPLTHQNYAGRWAVASIVGGIGILYALGLYRREVRTRSSSFRWSVALGKSGTVLLAFAAWVCVVPGSPFNSISWYTPSVGAIIGLLVGSLLGALAILFEA